MNRLQKLLWGLAGLVAVVFSAAAKPNILFILVDDLGRQDLGCYGSTLTVVIHLDAGLLSR